MFKSYLPSFNGSWSEFKTESPYKDLASNGKLWLLFWATLNFILLVGIFN